MISAAILHTRRKKAKDAVLAVVEHGIDNADDLAHDLGRSVKTARTRLEHAVILGWLVGRTRPNPTGGPPSVYYRPTAEGRRLVDR